MATQSGHSSQRFGVKSGQILSCLCKPTLEAVLGLVDQAEHQSSVDLSDDCYLVWESLVAHVSQVERRNIPSGQSESSLGNVLQLPGGGNAPPRWPLLCLVLSWRV